MKYTLTVKEALGGREPTKAEQKVIDACAKGETAIFGVEVPSEPTEENRISAALIRHLLRGGCKVARPHPKGVRILGAWIDDTLDFRSCHTRQDLFMPHCHFTQAPDFMDCEIGALYLDGSHLPSLNVERAVLETSLHMGQGILVEGTVSLRGARIGGQLSCRGGHFKGGLSGDGLKVTEDVFFSNGFKADAEVILGGARIRGQMACEDASFNGGLNAQTARIEGGFFWRKIAGDVPLLDLSEAKVSTLDDDAASWAAVETLKISGFRYDAIQSNMGVQDRLEWLARKVERELPEDLTSAYKRAYQIKEPFHRFDPQPYSQLAKVLTDQGDRTGAARVLQKRESLLRKSARFREAARAYHTGGLRATFHGVLSLPTRLFNGFFGAFFGYGHRPVYAVWWVLGIWLFACVLYGAVYAAGQMAPNDSVILTSAHWLAAVAQYDACTAQCIKPMHYWVANSPEATDYETFTSWLYALDLFVPLDALGQEATWAPSKDRGALGWIGYHARMPIQLAGWIITAVGAAVLTGLVGRKE